MNSDRKVSRFPENDIVSLLDVNRRYNLAESTAQDLTFSEVIELSGGLDELGDIKLGYGSSAGLQRLRELIASDTGVSPEQVLTTQGTALGLLLLALELSGEGCESVIVTPCFPPAKDTLAAFGHVAHCRLTFESCYRLTAESIWPHLSKRTRLVSLASPQNPSGVEVEEKEVRRILEAMQEICPEAWLFIDETYRDAVFGEAVIRPSFASFHRRVITGASVSKAHGAPGLRVGWLTVRDPDLMQRLTMAKMNAVISGSPLNEALAAVILANRDEVLRSRRALLAKGVDQVESWVAKHSELIEWVRPCAGALCCLRLLQSRFDEEAVQRFWNLIPECDLQIGNGTWFGEEQRVMRLGFGYLPLEVLPEALDALAAAITAAQAD